MGNLPEIKNLVSCILYLDSEQNSLHHLPDKLTSIAVSSMGTRG